MMNYQGGMIGIDYHSLLLPNRLTVTILSRFQRFPKHDFAAGTHKFISKFESITKVRLLPVLTETLTYSQVHFEIRKYHKS